MPRCIQAFGGGGGATPLFLDQTEDQRVEKTFLRPPPPLDDRPPSPYLPIHCRNLYPVDSAIIGFPNTYPPDSDLSGG